MNKKLITIIWISCLSPFFVFILLMFFIKQNTIEKDSSQPSKNTNKISFYDLENPKNKLATIIYSADNKILGEYYIENRSNTKFSEISPNLIDALISTEDIRFKKHSGIDVKSLFRAVFGVVLGKNSGGASTITQQLAKMLFTKTPASGFERVHQKLKEWVVAIELEKRYSKDEIITMYLNRFDWINQAVGISSAAKIYFNTTPEELTINQSAVLVGMLKNPSLYNPRESRNPEGTKNRRNVVLGQMLKNKIITEEEYDVFKKEPLGIDFQKVDHNEGLAPYFREQLRSELLEWCSSPSNYKASGDPYNLYTDGLVIYTTIDSKLQKHAEDAVKSHMSKLQKLFYNHWKGRSKAPYPSDMSRKEINKLIYQGIKRSERYRKLKNQGKTKPYIDKVFDKKVKTKLFSWGGEIDTIISPKDSVIYNKFFLHTGLMSMDPSNGHIKSYVGGINHKHFKYDHVRSGKRQVGSTFKPFLYSLAIQEGMSPCDHIRNVPVVFDAKKWGLPEDWVPSNATPVFDTLKNPLELQFGLANSINVVTAHIMSQYGPEAVVDLAKRMGVYSKLEAVPSLCLGTFDMSVFEMVGSYSTFVNQGIHTEPIFITKITDKNGVVLQDFTAKTHEAISEKTAAIMVKLLQGVVDGVYNNEMKKTRGTGMSLRSRYNLNAEIGGKTGTTQNKSDGWFIGITPKLVTGVWVGCEDRAAHFRTLTYGSGSYMALPIFGNYMKNIYLDKSIKNISQNERFKYSSLNLKELVNKEFNCNQNDLQENYSEETEEF